MSTMTSTPAAPPTAPLTAPLEAQQAAQAQREVDALQVEKSQLLARYDRIARAGGDRVVAFSLTARASAIGDKLLASRIKLLRLKIPLLECELAAAEQELLEATIDEDEAAWQHGKGSSNWREACNRSDEALMLRDGLLSDLDAARSAYRSLLAQTAPRPWTRDAQRRTSTSCRDTLLSPSLHPAISTTSSSSASTNHRPA